MCGQQRRKWTEGHLKNTKLLLENRAEENATQLQKGRQSQKKKKRQLKERREAKPKASVLLVEDTKNEVLSWCHRQISVLTPKITPRVSVIVLHCTSHLNYSTFKNMPCYSHRTSLI